MPTKTSKKRRSVINRLVRVQKYLPFHGAHGIELWLPERGPEDTVTDNLRLTLTGPKGGNRGYAALDTHGVDLLIEELQSMRKQMVAR